MSTDLVCPQCGEAFHDEDYCPRDGARLVPPAAAHAPDASPAFDVDAATDEAAMAPTPPEVEEMSPESEGRIASFMKRLGLRRVAGKSARGADAPAGAGSTDAPEEARASAEEPSSPLPEAVTEMGWRLAGPVSSSAGFYLWPVERPTESGSVVAGYFHRYRTGALTSDATYRRIEAATTRGLARVWAHGTVDVGGAREDYDLVSLPKPGVGLDRWLHDSLPSEQRAWHLFPALVQLLRHLDAAQVRPMVFEPAQLLYTEDAELWLASAVALADTAAPAQFRPELATSSVLPHGWAAPELTQQTMLHANAAVFSVGQVLAKAIWGEACSLAELQVGAVPFQTLTDARLARVLMGCLWPRPSERWTLKDLCKAVGCATCEKMPAAPPWASLAPGASPTAFAFAGASFWRLDDLLAAATKAPHWSEATARIEALLDWAEGTSWVGQVKLIREALAGGRSADWGLVALMRAVRPDAPLSWRELDLSDTEAAQSLAGLAQRALKEGNTADVAAMRALFQADLRGAFSAAAPNPPDFASK
jgi:hypothetical protein